ncbi:retroviral-like aspartic protease family protein [Sphingomonas sp. RP10(2022)]|uniref:Retroviral-like aspartic protease family protein n=1 Tax=Sphingomonas liriopis TaxID=2949094 RepID=A0A9X2HZP3_9SPHN|nr:retroviral-like aspartic protease family protein [Sphingomonas liriopis]MCP3735815.1 retroviral-like aspartic protease family protein [Sphingomonas liriopis]
MVAPSALVPVALLLFAAQEVPPAQRAPTIRPEEATLDDTLEVTGDSVAGAQVETRMAVDVTVDGHGPYRFVVDSGADRSVIGGALAMQLRLPAGPMVTLHGVAGASPRATVRIARLGIGGSVVADVAAPTLPERYLGAQGLVGIDALRGQRLRLDFETQAITIEDTRQPVTTQADEIVVTARRSGGQLILTQARAGTIGVRAVVDTGSQITVGNLALRDALFRRGLPPMVSATLVSVTGEAMTVPVAIVPELRIGGIVMRGVRVGFADLPPFRLFGLRDRPAMLLGTDLMGSFRRVSLDFGAKKVRFQLYRCRTIASAAVRRMRDEGAATDCSPPRGSTPDAK